MIGRKRKIDGVVQKSETDELRCDADLPIPVAHYPVPCGMGEQGFDNPGVDALYDLRYDPHETINLLRSPYVQKSLSQLHPDEKDDIVPYEKARGLQMSLVDWLKATGSEYASAVAERQMQISHINQAPMLARPLPDVNWKAGTLNSFALPSDTFLDVEGDKLTFAGTLDRDALPHWLEVDINDGSVHGTPPNKCKYLLRLTASDGKAGSAFVELQLSADGD